MDKGSRWRQSQDDPRVSKLDTVYLVSIIHCVSEPRKTEILLRWHLGPPNTGILSKHSHKHGSSHLMGDVYKKKIKESKVENSY